MAYLIMCRSLTYAQRVANALEREASRPASSGPRRSSLRLGAAIR